ncbi:hypothetical protein Ocin01_11019 [Orchesella cincta]|uniref:Uncharacterized protein n=1 Tax=Orchesella cincta TaxID=48709 RepID=A0A1D2MRD8_ORCCI|nr:hypothetical protein Ocin01_11019 [Orchesella cincta]
MFKTVIFVASSCLIASLLVTETTAEFGKGLFICRNGTMAPSEGLTDKLKNAMTRNALLSVLLRLLEGQRSLINLVKTEFPEAQQANALERAEKCFEDRTFDKEDKTCSSIAEFSVCGTKLVVETTC